MNCLEKKQYICESCPYLDKESIIQILEIVENTNQSSILVGPDGTRIDLDILSEESINNIYNFIYNILEFLN